MSQRRHEVDRRTFLGRSLAAVLFVPAAGTLASLAGCGEDATKSASPAPSTSPTSPAPSPAPPAAAPAPAPTARPGAPAEGSVTEVPGNAPLVSSLQYVIQSQTAGQRCDGCQLYTAVDAGRGRCSLFPQGLVAAGGHCMSWVKRQS